MNETETRAEHIDPALAAAGWGGEVESGKFSRVRREYEITKGRIEGGGRRARGLIADYVLVYQNTPLAVVEAKAWDKPLTEGVAQAKLYAQKLGIRFAYATNGQGWYEIDMTTGAEGAVAAVPSPQALWDRTFALQNLWRDRFAQVPFEDKGSSHPARYYQDSAVAAVLEALCEGKNRMLLTLATGTGKTFIAFQLAWKLFHARWNVRDWQAGEQVLATRAPRLPRILLLADRVVLADQAFSAFSAFPDDAMVRISPDEIRKKGRVPTNGSVFFTIFQTFMSGGGAAEVDDEALSSAEQGTNFGVNFGEYPPDFFDFIIIDECHRGGANDEGSWRAILEYFSPAVQLGLTATPKREVNADTYRYFGEPVYTYSLKDGINDGFLTPFRVKQIATTLDDYQYTADDTVLKGEIDASKRYEEGAFNRELIIPEREKKRVEIFMRDINQAEKTLVFCATQAHALMVRDLINQVKTSRSPDYCHRVAADDGKVGDQHLSDFQDNEKTIPTILTTSRKLSTGVDARNVRNIVLMRPVGSMIEFKQIIGRGTRLYEGKEYFTIYDFVQAYKRFSDAAWDGEAVAVADINETTQTTDVQDKPEQVPAPDAGASVDMGQREPRPETITIRLADGKARRIQHMTSTSFWHPDGKPMSAAQFVESLFGELPQFFNDEDELRSIWSDPDTRKKLLDGLAEKGFGTDKMAAMQAVIDAPNSDLFDVLAHVAFAAQPHTRSERANGAKGYIANEFNLRQQAFLDFVLQHYVDVGVTELAVEKLMPLLKLKYNDSLPDALADLGDAGAIRQAFVGFQRHLYQSNFVRT